MKNLFGHVSFLLLLLAATNGCSKTNNVDTGGGASVEEGKACTASDQCGAGNCVAGFCRRPCDTDATCPTDSICLGDGTASGCRLSEESQCVETCANSALACGMDGSCRMPCQVDQDCARDGSVCLASTCVNSGEAGADLSWFSCPGGITSGLLCDGAQLLRCNGSQPGVAQLGMCASDALCEASVAANAATCKPAACEAGEVKCQGADGATLGQCRDDLAGLDDLVACETPSLCEQLRASVEGGAATEPYACPEPTCDANEVHCTDGQVLRCNDGRTGFVALATCETPAAQCDPGSAACIALDVDALEVSRSQYKAFVDAVAQGTIPPLPAECAGHTAFEPEGLTDWPNVATTAGGLPITHVDWCDASAYCAWAGRRLCGRLSGGSVPATSFAAPSESQWMNACTSGGQFTATYGNWDGSGHADTCNGNASQLAAGGAFPDCHSPTAGYEAFLDLSGNVAEWEDACTNGGQCHVRGGSYLSSLVVAQLGCAADRLLDRTARANDVGFRCCGD